jgi:hypothetical protein
MKLSSIIPIACLCLLALPAIGQEEEQGVDLLKAPTSPASQLLNIAPSTIERPSDLTALWVSVYNATNSFNKLPSSYAFDIAPSSMFNKGTITLKSLQSTKPRDVIWQSLVISAGINSVEDTATLPDIYKAGIGFKLSFVRAPWNEGTLKKYNALVKLQEKLTDFTEELSEELESREPLKSKLQERDSIRRAAGLESAAFKNADSLYNLLRLETLATAIAADPNAAAIKAEIKQNAREFKIIRKGWYLDLAGGFSARFPTNELGYSFGDRSGAWLTGGYDGGDENLSLLGIARYLYQPESIFADPTGAIPTNQISTFDAGLRFLYSTKNDQFAFSLESIYRSVLSESVVDPSWKLMFSAEYDIGFNQKLSFNFGRDFDGMVTKGGNVVAALNFLAGFGNKKKVK